MKCIIIGAGPVGLMTAIKLQSLPAISSVIVIEKRKEYTRQQWAVLNYSSLKMLPKIVFDKLFGVDGVECIISKPSLTMDASCYGVKNLTKDMFGVVVLKNLENTLFEFVIHKSKVQFIIGVNDMTLARSALTINGQKLSFDILIIADGASSETRKHYFGTPKVLSPKFHGAVFNFIIPKLELGPNVEQKFAKPQHRFRLFRHRSGELNLGIQLSPAEFADLQKRGDIHKDPQFKHIRSVLHDGLKVYGLQPQTLKFVISWSTFPIQIQSVDVFGKKSLSKFIFLIGDAAMTTHFFTGSGLNTGWKQVKVLRKMLSEEQPDKWLNVWNDKLTLILTKTEQTVASVGNRFDQNRCSTKKNTIYRLSTLTSREKCNLMS